ncbi:MAG TPA: hypothetical protein VGY55_03765 [Pirellulales bacterium]|jgi:hypothetical protein|nr:hypothetical protein [Pirellulales bacterium]
MKASFVVMLSALLVQTCIAAEVEDWYFVGEVKLSSESGQSLGSQAMLVHKTYDPGRSLIVERAVVVKPDGTVDDYPMNLPVKGNTFTVEDPKKSIEGSGTLFGPAWHWTYFKGTYKATNGAQIDDENFMADPDVGTARKKISTPDGKVVMVMDMTLKSVTRETFEILTSALLKKGK